MDATAAQAGLDLIKQQSQLDAQTGRVLLPGAFGVGGMLDLRGSIYETGLPEQMFSCGEISGLSAAASLGITAIDRLGILTVSHHWFDDPVTTSMTRRFVSNRRVFIQTATSETSWSPWREVWSGENVESGSNGNGFYLRFPDGTLECRINNIQATYQNQYVISGTWNFPAAFVDVTNIVGEVTVYGNTGMSDAARGKGPLFFQANSGAQATFGVLGNAGSYVSGEIFQAGIIAKGRWF